ncbi:hypothetical protein GCM10009835_10790 [Planosporangium flavigriseum]
MRAERSGLRRGLGRRLDGAGSPRHRGRGALVPTGAAADGTPIPIDVATVLTVGWFDNILLIR